ncbi:hypothetical protein M1329_00040 [Candidatus Marsarchaeota archaeon]|nr:hypothetical protein [Candidatus Marsarchaeota archaeon]MCL5100228.1 hypothetical protein [Candidatus Marsarchaeota archaeon]
MVPRALLLLAALLIAIVPASSFASYTVTYLNTTVTLNTNSSAQVTEVLTVKITGNTSVSQYETDRLALNLTLSSWQQLIGSTLVQHIINPGTSLYSFKFLPGPLIHNSNGGIAYLVMTYYVNNVTYINQTAPRTYVYTFNPADFNFEHGASGDFLPQNTTLEIVLPSGATIENVYPIPDAPASAITNGYTNTTQLLWFDGEPLSKFTLVFVIHQSLSSEVAQFFGAVYREFGIFAYVLIALIVIGIIVYTYFRASSK